MAEKLVQLFVNQKEDVEPEMANLDQRWDLIVQEVEKRIKSNEAFRMVEVEEIKTTISHLSIPSEPVVTVTQPSPVIDPDEEIITLIGMISHKKSLITIFGHKHFRHKFHQKIDIFHVKISTASNFGSYLV